ncbi:MAG: hypothetical protein PHD15_01685 [Clostridia bacterium]|nr:hypothetical protein [Clostridia bacterium]MDD4386462.1 hypothetical protein [Clostridia bacterium]
MEENLQRVFSGMLAVIIFFLLPMYIAFEKKDDVSYALAVKVTSELVENVRNNGYLSKKMYDDYLTKLSVTNNTYDIKMEHKSYIYNPVICSYDDVAHTKLIETFEYDIYKNQYLTGNILYNSVNYGNLVLSYARNEEIYTEVNILDALNKDIVESPLNLNFVRIGMTSASYGAILEYDIPLNPNIYIFDKLGPIYAMNKGDSYTIRVKNINTTTAEFFFNALTIGMLSEPMPRVYVNYGCTIQNEKYKTWQ